MGKSGCLSILLKKRKVKDNWKEEIDMQKRTHEGKAFTWPKYGKYAKLNKKLIDSRQFPDAGQRDKRFEDKTLKEIKKELKEVKEERDNLKAELGALKTIIKEKKLFMDLGKGEEFLEKIMSNRAGEVMHIADVSRSINDIKGGE